MMVSAAGVPVMAALELFDSQIPRAEKTSA